MKEKIGIIGGGREGQWWKRFFEGRGHQVFISDQPKDNALVIRKSDVIILAVPISSARNAAKQIMRLSNKRQLVISVCGLMMLVERILKKRSGNTIFLHRMTGPHVSTMKGHNLIVSGLSDIGPKWSKFLKRFIKETEARIVHAAPNEHDNMVGLTQATTRIISLSLGIVVLEAPRPVVDFTNTTFSGLIAVLARIIDFGHLLTRDMIVENPFAKQWLIVIHGAMLDMKEKEDFEEIFSKLQKFLGEDKVKAGSKALASMPSWWN